MNSTFRQTSDFQPDTPDLAILRQSKKSCNDQMINIEVFHTQTSYLPLLYDKLKMLNSALNQAHIRLRDSAQKLELDIDSRTAILQGYLLELEQSSDEGERTEILGDMAEEFNAILNTARRQALVLAPALLSLSEAFDRTATLSNLAGFNAEQERLPEEIQNIETSKSKVEQDRATVTAAINAIEIKGFSDIAQDTILNGEKIAKLGATPPQLAVIELALDLLKQSLQKLDVALNYLGLIKLRDSLRARINGYADAVRDKQQELLNLNRRIKMIHAMHAFDDDLRVYRREFSKVVAALRAFETRYNRITQVDATGIREFMATATALASYLRPIR